MMFMKAAAAIMMGVAMLMSMPEQGFGQTQSQTQPQTQPRGDRALFGGGVGNAEQVLSVSSSLGASYYDTLSGVPATDINGQPAPSSTWLGHGSGMLGYMLGTKYVQVNASGGAFSYYYPDNADRWVGRWT